MKTAQELVNALDSENAGHWWRRLLVFLLIVSFFAIYTAVEYRSFSNPEAMDMAQLARNISEGKGYVTDNIRISSAMLVAEANGGDYRIEGNHPDIVNPPVYPVILAGLLKAIPLNYTPSESSSRYLPEMVIMFFNQLLILVAAGLLFSIGKRLFDKEVAFFAAAMFFLSNLVWRFSQSGLPTLLSMVLILCLFRLLIAYRFVNLAEVEDKTDTQDIPSIPRTILWGVLIGLLVGTASLTQYALGWLVLPVAGFVLAVTRNTRKTLACVVVLLTFAAVLAPWIYRNIQVSGLPYGLATYAPAADTVKLSGDTLERISTPDILAFYGPEQGDYKNKFLLNISDVIQNGIPSIGGSWLTMCFFAGILLPFVGRGLNSIRFLLIICLSVMAIVQAVVRTHLSTDVPLINSENLLVIFMPLILVFGAAFIFTMIEQINYGLPAIRTMIVWLTGGIICLPTLCTLVQPSPNPLAWPPYHPQTVARISSFFQPEEMIMSDMPWAVAWYGKRQSLCLPMDPDKEFFKINDGVCTINGIYLTQLTIDRRLLSDFMSHDHEWGDFVVRLFTRSELPDAFPLRAALGDLLPDQVLLAEWERWKFTNSEQ